MNSNDISWKTINRYFKNNPNIIVNHHIDSYNAFFSKGIKEIFKDRNPIRFFKEYDKDAKEYKKTSIIEYFDKYHSFCLDLTIDKVLKGELNFTYK